ncbi:MAG: helix-turn-helix domain-containing protein [Deltaproteobacteria bacterium]|nr:helix-turn-helix domain-containing protein [Deltaproteobacteria bacterium]
MNKKELLGIRVKELRKAKGLTQEKLSEQLNIDPKQLSRIEVGKSFPSFDTLENITRVLEVEMKELFEFERHLKSPQEMRAEIEKLINKADDEKLVLLLNLIRAAVEK